MRQLMQWGWLFVVVIGCARSHSPQVSALCPSLPVPTVLATQGDSSESGSTLLQRGDLDPAPGFWSQNVSVTPSLSRFREAVVEKLRKVDAVTLLTNSLEGALSEADRRNVQRAIERSSELIRPISCIEDALLGHQADRLDMALSPTEFTAFFLRSGHGTRLRIYYYTVNAPGIGRMDAMMERVEQDLKTGDWILWANLHNHNFFLDAESPGGCAESARRCCFSKFGGEIRSSGSLDYQRV